MRKRINLRFLILLFSLVIQGYSYDKQAWEKIIFFTDGKPEVVSQKFYLEPLETLTSENEFMKTVELLRSQKYGRDVACNYPLRYTFLQSQGIELPEYNLQECSELTAFVSNFEKSDLYLAFSSEYISVPSSAFGHIMLLLKRREMPFTIANTIHFAAETDKQDGFFQYNYKGLTGGYKGYYILDYFFKKLYLYNTKEQRNIYLYKLDFSSEEILQISYALFELRKASFRYYFFNKNCASYTTKLLKIPTKGSINEELFYLPIDTLKEFENRIVDKEAFLSLIYKIDYLYNSLSKGDQRRFKEIIQTSSSVDNTISNRLKLTLIYYYQFQFRKFHISYKNYNSIINLHYKELEIPFDGKEPLQKRPSSIALEYQFNEKIEDSLLVSYRPIYSDIYDFDNNPLQTSEFKVLETKLQVQKKSIKLNSLTLLSIKSFGKRTPFYQPISWQIYSGINRENNEIRKRFENMVGLGVTNQYFNSIRTSLLCNVGMSNTTPYIRPELYASYYIKRYFKIETTAYKNFYLNSKSYEKFTTSVSLQKNDTVYGLQYMKSSNNNAFSLFYKYYF